MSSTFLCCIFVATPFVVQHSRQISRGRVVSGSFRGLGCIHSSPSDSILPETARPRSVSTNSVHGRQYSPNWVLHNFCQVPGVFYIWVNRAGARGLHTVTTRPRLIPLVVSLFVFVSLPIFADHLNASKTMVTSGAQEFRWIAFPDAGEGRVDGLDCDLLLYARDSKQSSR